MFSLKRRTLASRRLTVSPKTVGPIGVDLAYGKLYMVQLQRDSQKQILLLACCHIDYDISRDELLESPVVFKSLIKAALKKGPFHGREVVAALPSTDVRILPIAYQKSPQGDAKSIIDQLQQRIDGSLDDYVIDYRLLRSNPSDEENLALVVMAKREKVISYLQIYEQAGLRPKALDVGPTAIQRLISAIPTTKQETVLVINTARTKSYLTIVSGQRLLLDQEIQFSEFQVLNKLAEALDIDYSMAEELIRKNGLINDRKSNSGTLSLDINDVSVVIHEICKPQFLKLVESINRLLVFSASETRGVPVSRVYLLGAVGRWKGSDLLLRSMLNIEVAPIREEDDFYACFPIVKGKSVNGIVPEMVKATGYALRGLVGDA